MRRFVSIFIALLIFVTPVLSDDFFDSYTGIQDEGNLWDNQKPVTDKEFEEVIDALQAKKKQK